jgi:sporulation protein YlmC with PRC-barrel domain
MTVNYLKRYGAIAIVSAAAATGLRAQETRDPKPIAIGEPRKSDAIAAPLDHHEVKAVSKVNKATGLTGMAVKNTANEKLGDVKDIVLDLTTGKISYVVLSVGGFLGIGDKLIAVPPSAFTLAPTGDGLVLDADKAKLHAAPGFVQTSWPNVNDPSLTTYWRTDRDAVGTGSSGTEIRQRRSPDQTIPQETPKRD